MRLQMDSRGDEEVPALSEPRSLWRNALPTASKPKVETSVAPERTAAEDRLVPASASPRHQRWVILGTGTGIGKTFVACGLVRLLAERGVPVAGLKPIETGLLGAGASSSDAAELAAASAGVGLPLAHPLYAFADPVTPARAARASATPIEVARVASWVASIESAAVATSHFVVESAGGVFSPLADEVTNFELAQALSPAIWVLVAPDRLGVLHDVGSCLLAMEARGRRPDYLVLSAPEHPDASTGTNREELARNSRTPPTIVLGRDDTAGLQRLLAKAEPAPTNGR
jgi:dethiobiotin synthetase